MFQHKIIRIIICLGFVMIKKQTVRDKISDTFDLPKEIILGVPNIKIIGNSDMMIENHRGILEYTDEILRMNSGLGVIKIQGRNLEIKEVSQEDIQIHGSIESVEFIK